MSSNRIAVARLALARAPGATLQKIYVWNQQVLGAVAHVDLLTMAFSDCNKYQECGVTVVCITLP